VLVGLGKVKDIEEMQSQDDRHQLHRPVRKYKIPVVEEGAKKYFEVIYKLINS
jgi:hypothetical protein